MRNCLTRGLKENEMGEKTHSLLGSMVVVLNQDDFCFSGGTWRCLETFFDYYNLGGRVEENGVAGI